ncbi:hypothetical protein VMCG_10031 [Cytospora schulzeri]|uniref:Uncharacterized protein n=1 Tax=Cytospora schulzeri TaxID=448051 RepID=A0A423VI81_9PEZI|nr:hypothetical protein VMCG_10031 [Valsa malicola]
MTPLALPSLAGAAMQFSGIEKIAPTYYLFAIAAGDTSTVNPKIAPEVADVVLPATILAYVIPGTLMALIPLTATEVSRSSFTLQSLVTYAFFLAPVAVPLLTTAVSKAMRWFSRRGGPRITKTDDETKGLVENCNETGYYYQPTQTPVLMTAYAVSFAIQAAEHIHTLARAFIVSSGGELPLTTAMVNIFLKPTVPGQMFSSISLYAGATLGFGLYTVWDLRRRGYTTDREATKRGPERRITEKLWPRRLLDISTMTSVEREEGNCYANELPDFHRVIRRMGESSRFVWIDIAGID